MSAYATLKKASPPTPGPSGVPSQPQLTVVEQPQSRDATDPATLIGLLIEQLADRIAVAIAERLGPSNNEPAPEWLDSRAAANYLGVHRDTLRKLAAERAIPAEQEGPGCRLFFRRTELDEWRRAGGRTGHLSGLFADAA